MADTQHHWDQVYRNKTADAVSWYQTRPHLSLAFIADSGLPHGAPLLDVGGGASTLVDHLLEEGYTDISVLDISAEALQHARMRLGKENAQDSLDGAGHYAFRTFSSLCVVA